MNLGIPRRPRITPTRAAIAGGTAVVVATAVTLSLTLIHTTAAAKPTLARLSASSCTGPAGAAYIAVAGYQAFDAINTANCKLIQQYNVGDPAVPGNPNDSNYSSTDEAVAISGDTLYFADTGNDTVAVINAAALEVSNYENPAETLIPVGINPDSLTVTPDGSHVWVADTGPQTGLPALADIKVISTASNTVTSTLNLPTEPRAIAFSPSASTAYVTTSIGVYVINAATLRVTGLIPGLGSPEGVTVSPDGKTVYVTNTAQGLVDVISAATNRVTRTIAVGQMPWQLALSSDGGTLYVANGDSNSISVISTASDTVTSSIPLAGDPVSLALTPDGSELWAGGLTSAVITVFDTASETAVGSFNAGYENKPNYGDGEEPTSIAITSTPAVGS
jgi:YVTN family beta-propeller protein